MKTITISGIDYNISCNALSHIKYKSLFNRRMISDIDIIKDYLVKQTIATLKLQEEKYNQEELQKLLSKFMMEYVDEFLEALTRITYIMILTSNENIGSYEKWLESIPRLSTDDQWIFEVTEYAVDCFC